jgi:hypothetical protein
MHSAPATLLLLSLFARLGEAQSTSPGAVSDSTVQPLTPVSRCTAGPGGQLVTGSPDTAEATDNNCASAMAAAQAQMSPAQMGQLQALMNPDLLARMQALMSPAQMAQLKGQMSPELLAQMQAQMRQVPKGQMQQAQMPPGQMPIEVPGMPPQVGGPGMPMPGINPMSGEAGGKNIELSSHLVRDLKKGKTVVRNIDWTPGSGTVSNQGSSAFTGAMAKVAAAMKQAGGSYRVDLYMDQQSGNVVVRTLGPQRLAAVQASLAKGGATPQMGQARKDGDPRLEIVKLK